MFTPSPVAPGEETGPAVRSSEATEWDVEPEEKPPIETGRVQLASSNDDWESGHDVTSTGHVVVEGPSAAPVNQLISAKKPNPDDASVRCVDCDTILYFSKHATSTICSKCSAYVSLQSYNIRNDRRENIKTRGDITIHKKASLTASAIVCSNLKVFGQISGQIDCDEVAEFRCSGKVVGSMRCKHLVIHKNCELEFIPGIRAESATIKGSVTGDIICEGTIKIAATGGVIGDCIAPAINLEDGGVLSGLMRIMKPDQELEDDYTRRAEAAQEELFAEEE